MGSIMYNSADSNVYDMSGALKKICLRKSAYPAAVLQELTELPAFLFSRGIPEEVCENPRENG
jgi:hypothetical protein